MSAAAYHVADEIGDLSGEHVHAQLASYGKSSTSTNEVPATPRSHYTGTPRSDAEALCGRHGVSRNDSKDLKLDSNQGQGMKLNCNDLTAATPGSGLLESKPRSGVLTVVAERHVG